MVRETDMDLNSAGVTKQGDKFSMKNWKKISLRIGMLAICVLAARPAHAMHIAEGFLPAAWCGVWYLLCLPFFIWGYYGLKTRMEESPRSKILLGIAGGFAFLLSALKAPSVGGSSSHLTGTGLGTLLLGPRAMTLVGVCVLLFQALLLAHGGLTTLGANAFSMAIAGPFVAHGVGWLLRRVGAKQRMGAFWVGFSSDIFTYVVTSFQLALAFPSEVGGFWASFGSFLSVFAVVQLPLAVLEGFITAFVVQLVQERAGKGFQLISTEK